MRAAVMMHASMLEPDPRSLKIPAAIATLTRARASSRYERLSVVQSEMWNEVTSMSGFQPLSKIAIAARLPDPMVT